MTQRPRKADVDDIDYDGIMQANLARVFGERDGAKRTSAIRELYANDAVFYEAGASASGHGAVMVAVETLLARLPPDLTFTVLGPAVGHHGMARLRWSSGTPTRPSIVTGTDVARFEGGRIKTLHVFLDPPI